MTTSTAAAAPPFGTAFVDRMGAVEWADGRWGRPRLAPLEPLALHPAAHVLHYGSACFEGLKAHRGVDGAVRIFRLDRHVARMQTSADALVLPIPPAELVVGLVVDVVRAGLDVVPDAPGSLYVRPTLIGTEANVGAAAKPSREAMLFVLASPVADYFSGGLRPLVLAVETEQPRTTPAFGVVKSGANYAMALGTTRRAAEETGADQVLFAPGGRVEETGASNFLLLDGERVITPALSGAFLHGVTRASILHLAADLGWQVEERDLTVDEVLTWARRPDAEAALSGTAAGLAPVGEIVHRGARVPVGDGGVGPHASRLRQALTEVQTAQRPAPAGWLTEVR